MPHQFDDFRQLPGLGDLHGELQSALVLYWKTAADVLKGGGITVLDPPEGYLSLESNFFSAMFLYSYYRLGIPRPRRVLYATINQCFRGMVTGCDNILDDEYKRTLKTDLPPKAWRFRSVLDIMASEHVMFNILLQASRNNEIPEERLVPALNAALCALTRSGAQEAGEEQGAEQVLPPETVLKAIHHYKTGILFQSPWAVPTVTELLDKEKAETVKEGLYRIGMGCQIMDDLVDLQRDIAQRRHNYVASLIYHVQGPKAWAMLRDMAPIGNRVERAGNLVRQFPEPIAMAVSYSRHYLRSGIDSLFGNQAAILSQMVISFLARRIGAEAFLDQHP
jgi:hypothetical protein